jgi:hypothetical protein
VLKCEDGLLQAENARNQPLDCKAPKQAHLEQQTIKRRRKSKMHKEQLDSIPMMFPALRLGDAPHSHGPCGRRPRQVELPDSSSVIQQTAIASETVTSVRGSPLPVADALSLAHFRS